VTDEQRRDEPVEPEETPAGGASAASAEQGVGGDRSEPGDPAAIDFDPEDEAILAEATAEAEDDLVAEYRDRAARAEAELVNFRTRVERDRQSNRDAAVADVIRAVLPALDDLDRAEAHGDIPEGSSMAIVVTKLRGSLEKFGLQPVGEVGEAFDPTRHEAIASFPGDVERDTVVDVVQRGYLIGERVVRPAKVAVQTPKPD